MKKIDHFMLPEHTNSLYENEAISSISLTKEVADKINEIVDSINQLSQTDLEWKQIQEGTIRKGVLFMKDNLVNSLNELLQLLTENGFIENRIEYITNVLSARVDNLLSQLAKGNTGIDAEVLDARVTMDGVVYNTIREAILAQITNVINYTNSIPGFIQKNLVSTLKPGYYFNGSLLTNDTRARHTNPIYLLAGSVVFTTKHYDIYGNRGEAFLWVNNGISETIYNVAETDYNEFHISKSGYYVFNLAEGGCVSYSAEHLGAGIGLYFPEDIQNKNVLADGLDTFQRKNLVHSVSGGLWGQGLTLIELGGFYHSNPIYLEKGKTVYTFANAGEFGNNRSLYKVNEDGTQATQEVYNESETEEYNSYTIPATGYYSVNSFGNTCCCVYELEDLGAPIGCTLPNDFVAELTSNILTGKTVAFDGDSICCASTDYDSSNKGWAGRISAKNTMICKNYANNGGTIAQVNNYYCIGKNIDTIAQEMPELDYLILEGGTNDADLVGSSKIGSFTADNYSGIYDTNTFSGALETLFYKAINHFPHAKIGYIVAPKMGGGTQSERRYTFFTRAMEICKKWGIPYLNLWDGCTMNPMLKVHYDGSLTNEENSAQGKFYVDGQHPTTTGYDYITPVIEAWMKTI